MTGNIKYPYEVHYTDLPGNCNIAYMDEGKGDRTLLFIHGLANYSPVWKKNIEALKSKYRCVAIDLPGNGLSDRNEHKFSMDFFAEVVFNFIEKMGLKNVCLAGHSMGGQIAITTLLKYPTCANALILCAPAGFEVFSAIDKTIYYSTISMFSFLTTDEQNLRTTVENSFYRHSGHSQGLIKELTALIRTYKLNYYKKMIDACIKSMLEESVNDKLQLIQQPSIVFFGNNDALIPNRLLHHTTTQSVAKDGVKKMPNAKLMMIADCGHFVQWEKAEEVNEGVMSFLKDV